MPDIAGVRVGSIGTETEPRVDLKGMPQNPGRDPKAKSDTKGTIGDKALMDSVLIVGIAWLFVIMLYFSLRHHNV